MITERRKGQYSPCHLILHYSWNIFNSWSSQFANFFCTVLVNGTFRWTRAANHGSEALCCRCACVHFFPPRLQPSERCFHPVALGSLPWHSRRAPVPAPVPERTLSKVKPGKMLPSHREKRIPEVIQKHCRKDFWNCWKPAEDPAHPQSLVWPLSLEVISVRIMGTRSSEILPSFWDSAPPLQMRVLLYTLTGVGSFRVLGFSGLQKSCSRYAMGWLHKGKRQDRRNKVIFFLLWHELVIDYTALIPGSLCELFRIYSVWSAQDPLTLPCSALQAAVQDSGSRFVAIQCHLLVLNVTAELLLKGLLPSLINWYNKYLTSLVAFLDNFILTYFSTE